ncbi:MAG: hypothetical protein HYV27_00470 [Candidatus Hydrogenedentes bacterium]|nr:hypothetical protein [Candidatus Hydrogenedentota bacterium]
MTKNLSTQVFRGAAAGGGVLLLLLAVALGALYMYPDATTGQSGDGLRAELREVAGSLKRENRIPSDLVPVCDRLIATGLKADVGLFAPWLVTGVLRETLSDGIASDSDRQVLDTCLEFLESHPAPNPLAIGAFLDAHPELAALRESLGAVEGSVPPGA